MACASSGASLGHGRAPEEAEREEYEPRPTEAVQGERGGAEARQEQAGEATVERVRWPLEQAVEALVVLQQFQQQRECVGGLQAKKVRSAAFWSSAQSAAAASVWHSNDEASTREPGGQPRAGAWACGTSGWSRGHGRCSTLAPLCCERPVTPGVQVSHNERQPVAFEHEGE